MTGALIALAVFLLLGIAWFFFSRWMERRLTSLYRDRTDPKAQVRAACYVRESSLEEPGVAQIADETLSIFTVMGKSIEIPLDQIKLTNIRKSTFLLGRHPWWGKTCFWLESPKTIGLVLGFKDPQPWINFFSAK